MNTVEVHGACKSYGKGDKKNFVLNNLSMTVERGSIYGLIGSSGCGKTTLLSCILGMISLDEGNIKILGHEVDTEKVLKCGHRIGYMPQETALVDELTVKETIYYFGNIHQMKLKELNERYAMIKMLLDFPPDDMRVEQCSGGEKRRVSFAAAIIHEPDLLILDEPTVGLDPVLREKVWNFLWNVTRTTKLSVIITTHYLAEAQRSDRVGFLKDGNLVIEDSPSNIMSIYGGENLETAFLSFCLNGKMNQIIEHDLQVSSTTEQLKSLEFETTKIKPDQRKFRWQVLKALMNKHWIQFKRQPAAITFMTLIPIVQVLFFMSAIGGNPIGLNIAIVNNEIESLKDCANMSSATSIYELETASCRFLNELDETMAVKVFYNTFEEALADAKSGKVIGIIVFDSNFTAIVNENFGHFNAPKSNDNSCIKIYLDQTDMQLNYFLRRHLFSAFKSYSEELMTSYNRSKKLQNFPMNFEEPIYGSFDGEFKLTMGPNAILQMAFFGAAGVAVASFVNDRKEGFWNRSLMAGVTASEMIVAQISIHSVMVLIQVLEMVLTAGYLLHFTIKGSLSLVLTILALYSWTGLFLGLFVSILSSSLMVGNAILFGFSSPMVFLSGMVWPVEGFHTILKYISYALPFTLPAISVNDIIVKGSGLLEPSVLKGLGVLVAWMAVSIFLGLKTLQIKKYSRNT